MSAARALLAALATAALLAGCGDDSDSDQGPAPREREAAHRVPDLPRGWKVHANRAGGFTVGLPPGWRGRARGTTSEIRSFDGLVVVTIAADRTSEALEIAPGESASRALASLPGLAEPIEPGRAHRFEHRYRAYSVRGSGRARNGIEQELEVIVLRRNNVANVTVLIAANADKRARPAARIAERVVRTLRTRPPNSVVR